VKRQNLVVFMGPPGSGKGSLSQLCVQNLGWVQLSTGHLCRKHISEQTEIGKQIDFLIKSGKLISDELMTNMVAELLFEQNASDKAVILDGFPRNVAQAEALHEIIKHKLPYFKFMIFKLSVSDEILLQRLLNRFICKNKDCQAVYSNLDSVLKPKNSGICDLCSSELIQRADDEISTIQDRLKIYKSYEHELINFYIQKSMVVYEISGESPLHNIFHEFKLLVGNEIL
jgi:adenylate kinase